MLGLFIGTLCLFALLATLRRRRYAYFMGYGPHPFWGHGPRACGRSRSYHDLERDWGFRGRRERGRRVFMYDMFRRLDTTPGQEKEIVRLVEGARQRVGETLHELAGARHELAAALGSEVLDGAALDAAFRRGGELFANLGGELQRALSGIHEALDPEQRRQLAELIADGSFGARFSRPGYGW
jgi:hypothetical protein